MCVLFMVLLSIKSVLKCVAQPCISMMYNVQVNHSFEVTLNKYCKAHYWRLVWTQQHWSTKRIMYVYWHDWFEQLSKTGADNSQINLFYWLFKHALPNLTISWTIKHILRVKTSFRYWTKHNRWAFTPDWHNSYKLHLKNYFMLR